MKRNAHVSEHTGSAGLDRQQDNVRRLAQYTERLLEALARTHGIGVKRIVMRDADYALKPSDLEGAVLIFDGPLTAPRNIVVPRATDASGYLRWCDNATGQDLTFLNPDGSQLLTAVAGVSLIVVSSDGPVGYT